MTPLDREAIIANAPEFLAHYRRSFFFFSWSGSEEPTFIDRYKAMYIRLYINLRRELAAARRGM